MKFSIKDFLSKCDQIRSFLRIWSYLLKKSLKENFGFCAVYIRVMWRVKFVQFVRLICRAQFFKPQIIFVKSSIIDICQTHLCVSAIYRVIALNLEYHVTVVNLPSDLETYSGACQTSLTELSEKISYQLML